MKWAIGVDLGGTHVSAAIVAANGKYKHRVKRELVSREVEYVVEEIAQAVTGVLRKHGKKKIAGIGIGCPGNIIEKTGVVRYSNNFRWRDVPLLDKLQKRLRRDDIHILNDARCATLGEYLHGVGKSSKEFVLITIGTGIGGGIVSHSRLLLGHRMGAGEVGHHTIRPDTGFTCTCGRIGCFEAQASSRGLLRHAKALAPKFPRSRLLRGISERNWKSSLVSQAAAAGDPHATAAWNIWLDDLAIGVTNIISFVNPKIIALGGGVGQTAPKLLAKPLTRRVDARTVMVPAGTTRIISAKLGNDAGIVGSASLVFCGGIRGLRKSKL